MLNAASRFNWKTAAAVIGALTLWRLAALAFDSTGLWVDETQYWLWSQNLDWGYFSKPPMIAFVLRAVTDLAGSDAAYWIRANGAVLHAVTAGLIGLSAARLYDSQTGVWAALIYISAPFATLGSWLFSTDTVLLPFFALALYAWLRMREAPSMGWAVVCGVAIGAGFLSKYAVIYLPLSLSIAAAFFPAARVTWRDAGIAAIFAIAVAAPNLIWNFANGGTTVRHIAEDNARIGEATLSLGKAAEFLISQFVVFGPVSFAALLVAVWLLLRRRAPIHSAFLTVLSLTVVILLTVQAARAGAYANWAVTGYVAGSVLAAAILIRWPRLLLASVALQLLLALVFPLAFVFGDDLRLPNGRLLAERYVGADALSRNIADAASDAGLSVIVAERRGVLADLFYTLRDRDLAIFAPPPDGRPHSYYEQRFPLPGDMSGEVLFVTVGAAPCPDATEIGSITPDDGIYRGTTFRYFRAPATCFRTAP